MYTSLRKIDIVTKGSPGAFIQTDHREAEEIASDPDTSTILALARVLNARAHAVATGVPDTVIRYVAHCDPPALLRDAVAAAGGVLEHVDGRPQPLAPTAADPVALADRAFRGLAARVAARVGADDVLTVLERLEAEIVASNASSPTEADDRSDSHEHWAAVCELAAVTAEAVRQRHQGAWEVDDAGGVPFRFRLQSGHQLMLAARAERFAGGQTTQSMFGLLDALDDMLAAEPTGPVLPSLRPREDVESMQFVARPLFPGAGAELPMIAYGHDSPAAFALMRQPAPDDLDALHQEALRHLSDERAEVERIEVGGVSLSIVGGSYYAAEKLLDVAFMGELHAVHGPLLAAAVPCRGRLLVTGAVPNDALRGLTVLRLVAERLGGEAPAISPAILLVQQGQVVGHVETKGEAESVPGEPLPARRPGLMSRLFGRR
jgi:hypothetical protein